MADSVEKRHKLIFETKLGVAIPLIEGRSSIVGRSERSIFYMRSRKIAQGEFFNRIGP